MSVVRFVHTDALRLGSPVAGLAESPDWLKRVACSAVRTAVTNVIETCVASRCQFLFIAGNLTESDGDLDLAVSWLSGQMATLREHGIRVVFSGSQSLDQANLRIADAIYLGPGQRLDVGSIPGGQLDFAVSSRHIPARPGSLGIETGSPSASRPLADMVYLAVPAERPSPAANSFDGVSTAHDRHLRLSAGCPQATAPSELGRHGCQLVEADLARQTMTARFCATDVIRFAQELVSCQPGFQVSQLCELLRERSRALGTSGRCTTVVEWVIDGQLTLSDREEESLCELELLKDLRSSLHAGHSGAWPCRIRFSDNSSVDVAGHRSLVTHEFSAVVRNRLARKERTCVSAAFGVIGLPLGCGSEVPVGLDVLRRVA